MSKFLERTQQMLPDEPVRYAFTGQTGLRPTWAWVADWLIVLNRPRIVAVTDDAVVVMKAGQLRWQRKTPKAILQRLPRATRLGPVGRRGYTRITLADERIWVSGVTHPLIEKADAEIDARVESAA
jgi:hypothetical protein